MRSVSVAYKRGTLPLHWIVATAKTAREAYARITKSARVASIRAKGYREYGIIGL